MQRLLRRPLHESVDVRTINGTVQRGSDPRCTVLTALLVLQQQERRLLPVRRAQQVGQNIRPAPTVKEVLVVSAAQDQSAQECTDVVGCRPVPAACSDCSVQSSVEISAGGVLFFRCSGGALLASQ